MDLRVRKSSNDIATTAIHPVIDGNAFTARTTILQHQQQRQQLSILLPNTGQFPSANQQQQRRQQQDDSSGRFFCKHCPNNYSAMRSLRDHERKIHLDKLGDAAFFCYRCSLPFYSKIALSAHFRWSSTCARRCSNSDDGEGINNSQLAAPEVGNPILMVPAIVTTQEKELPQDFTVASKSKTVVATPRKTLPLLLQGNRFPCWLCSPCAIFNDVDSWREHCRLQHASQMTPADVSYARTFHLLMQTDSQDVNNHLGISL